jgi:hypothetical protein
VGNALFPALTISGIEGIIPAHRFKFTAIFVNNFTERDDRTGQSHEARLSG